MKVSVRGGVRERLERAARRGYPDEVCGVLLGRRHAGGLHVRRALRTPNRAGSTRGRFVVGVPEFLRLDRLAADRGMEIVGVWHTHPDAPARPSRLDREDAWPDLVYLILPVRRGRPGRWRAWGAASRGRPVLREWALEEGAEVPGSERPVAPAS